MADPIQSYIDTLRKDLQGRIPTGELQAVLDESASHLHDLAEELGTPEAAVQKYGSPHHFARKILRQANPAPNPWRAAIFPLGSVTLAHFVLIAMPRSMVAQWFAAGTWLSPDVIAIAVTWLFVYGCFRARQFLVKPILAFAVWAVCIMTVVFSVQSVPVHLQGSTVLLPRQGGLALFQKDLSTTLSRIEEDRNRLQSGIKAFALAKGPGDLPESLRIGPELFVEPEMLAGPLDPPQDPAILSFRTNLFTQSFSMASGYGKSFGEAKAAWQRDGAVALARLNTATAELENDVQNASALYNLPWWVALSRTAWIAAGLNIRLIFAIVQFNLIGWALAEIFQWIKRPRRRFA